MKGRTFVAGALSGTVVFVLFGVLVLFGLASAEGVAAQANGSPRICEVAVPSARLAPSAIVAPQEMSIVKQTSTVKERHQARGHSSLPVPFVAPVSDEFGASDVYFNKKWIGIDVASRHSRESTSTTGGS